MSRMLEWMKSRLWRREGPSRQAAEVAAEALKPQGAVISGKYLALHQYLANRYADTVVLTFTDIEALLGFALPDLARVRSVWWTGADPAPGLSEHTDAWRLAHRTARPNLPAQIVVFERVS